ncbi:hypothetical protein [Pseudomonas farris]
MDLQLKDLVTIGVSVLALMVAVTSFYFANVHKPAALKLTILERSQDAEVVSVKTDEHNLYIQHRKVISKAKTNLSYSVSNTGKQALCIKSVEVLRGPSRQGNLRDPRPFSVVSGGQVSSFVIEPGDIKLLEVNYDHESDQSQRAEDKYRMLSLEVVSADGSRYQVCHDITNVMSVVSLHDPLWDGVSLGRPVRSEGYV